MTRNPSRLLKLSDAASKFSYRCNRRGISRVDVICLIAIAGLTLPLLTYAVSALRLKTRNNHCASNLRNLGIALESYHSTFQSFPPACLWDKAEMILDENARPARNPDTVKSSHQNWVQFLLPHMGEVSRANRFDNYSAITSESNRLARTQPFASMMCPMDPFNSASNQYVLEDSLGKKFTFARGNYAINGGPQTNAEQPGYLAFPIASGNVMILGDGKGEFQWWGNGVAGFNRCFSLADFANGLSTMVAIDEIRAGIVPEDPRGVWALGQIGSSVTWAHGINSDAFGPNNQIADSDDILEGKSIAAKYGIERFLENRMPFCAHCNYSNQATARSNHQGGVNVLMLDGVVKFVSNSVSPSLWHVMHARDTPAEVLRERFDERLSSQDTVTVPNEHPRRSTSGSDATDLDTEIVNSIGMQFKRIPAGTFVMGLPDKDNDYTFPAEAIPHRVRLTNSYFLGVFEVTQEEFAKVMDHNPSWHSSSGGGASLVEGVDTAKFPAEQVSWNDATEFCRRLSAMAEEKAAGRSYRLPTEAEWEFACRSGSTDPYPLDAIWEGEHDELGEFAGRVPHPTNPTMPPSRVGSYPANPFGLHDMRGNVFEWCEDWFLRQYYSLSPLENPKGPENGYLKTVRGMDWTFVGTQCKDFLVTAAPWQKNPYIGFRVICDKK